MPQPAGCSSTVAAPHPPTHPPTRHDREDFLDELRVEALVELRGDVAVAKHHQQLLQQVEACRVAAAQRNNTIVVKQARRSEVGHSVAVPPPPIALYRAAPPPRTPHPAPRTRICDVALRVAEGPDDRVDHKLQLVLRQWQ